MSTTKPHSVQIFEFDWDPREGKGDKWRRNGANLREASPVMGQTRSCDMSWDIETGFLVAAVGKRNAMGKIERPRFYAISTHQLAQIFFDHDADEAKKRYRL